MELPERTLFGRTGFPGFALGPAFVLQSSVTQIPKHEIQDVSFEKQTFLQALNSAKLELQNLSKKQKNSEAQEIIEAHLLMLEDPEWILSIENGISAKKNAIQSVYETGLEFKSLLESLDDEYMRARALDIQDLTERVIQKLQPEGSQAKSLHTPSILVAQDLLPSQFLNLDTSQILALVLENSSTTSHTAILAKTFEIPLIVGVTHATQLIHTSESLVIDALHGAVTLHPAATTEKEFLKKIEKQKIEKTELLKWASKRSISTDGVSFEVASNLSSLQDAALAHKKGTEGCGLFRSEFMLMDRKSWPTENEQFEIYKSLVQTMSPHKTVLRLFDIGGDKSLPYFPMPHEENPFLGVRGLRLLFQHPELLRQQIRACLRASEFGPLALMAPMVTTVEEVIEFKKTVQNCRAELLQEKKLKSSSTLEVGIMVEVPAIALALPDLTKELDFISIGTNDLIQYLCATDRMNSEISHLHDAYNPSVLKFLNLISQQVKNTQVWMGLCGELAALENYVPLLMAMGFRELSVSPGALLKTRAVVCQTSVETSKKLLEVALKARTSNDLKGLLSSTTS